MEREEKLDSFDVVASFKNGRSRSGTVLERDWAFYRRRTVVVLITLHGTTET